MTSHLTRPGHAFAAVANHDWLVVVSQTCDIVADKLEAEPFFEVLHCRPLPGKRRMRYVDLRSTRQIDFRPNRETHQDLVLTAHAIGRSPYRSWRAVRAPQPRPGSMPGPRGRQALLAWYALRAARPSWPDAFVRRIRNAVPALVDALTPLSDEIAQIRVAIEQSDEELAVDRPYHVAVFFVVNEATWKDDVTCRTAIDDAFNRFVAALNGCDGVEVNTARSEVVSGAEFTSQETQTTDEWNFANLIHREP